MGRRGKCKNTIVALVASAVLVIGLLPAQALAEAADELAGQQQDAGIEAVAEPASEMGGQPPDAVIEATVSEGDTQESDAQPADDDGVINATLVEMPSGGMEDAEEIDTGDSEGDELTYPAFDKSRTVNGVAVRVSASEGVFPAGAELSVVAVPKNRVETAVAAEREDDVNVAVSYTFDIKVMLDGVELQPAGDAYVKVSFALAEVADENLETSVYHVTEDEGTSALSAKALDVSQEDAVTAVVETDGFSYYTVEFTYNNLQYVLPGGSAVPMSEILSALELTGEVTAVEVSDTSLFSVSNKTGEWIVTSHRAFTTPEWMKVTIAGVEYEIAVTDDPGTEISTWADLKAALRSDGEYTLIANVKPDDPYWDDALEVPSGVTATLDLNGFTVDRGYTDDSTDTWDGSVFNVKGTLTVTDGSASQSGVITGGWNDQYGGGVQIQGGTFNLQGGTITGNRAGKTGFFGADGLGGGVYIQSGTFNMSGGTISGNKAFGSSMGDPLGHGGGVYITGGTFNFTGGTISGNDAGIVGGGVFLASTYSGHDGKINISGGASVTGNTVGSTTRNVYLEEGGKINVAGALTGKVGVAMQKPGVFTSGLPDNGTTANFKSDDAAYEVSLTDADEAQLAEATPYPLWVGGVQVTSGNLSGDCDGGGTWSYEGDETGGTLTLDNSNITGTYTYPGPTHETANIYADGLDLTFSLVGDSSLSGADRGVWMRTGDLTITGGGSLSASSTSLFGYGVNVVGDLTVTGGSKLTAKASGILGYGIFPSGFVTIEDGSTVTATGGASDISAPGGITITGSTVAAVSTETSSFGLWTSAITIMDSTVTATGGEYGISAISGGLTVSGEDSVVTAEGGTAAINASSGVTLNDGLVYVEGSADAQKAVIAKGYTVTYKVAGGTWADGTAADKTETVAEGAKPAEIPTGMIAADGYAGGAWDADPATAAITEAATFTYAFEAIPVKATLTFDLGGGTLDGKTGTITIVVNVGYTIKLPAAPTREGYTFKYWKGSQYAAGADYTVDGDHAFTAEWEKDVSGSDGSDEKSELPATGDGSEKKSALPATGDGSSPLAAGFALMALGSLFVLWACRTRRRSYRGNHSR